MTSTKGTIQKQKMTPKHVSTLITCMACIFGPIGIMFSCAGMNYMGVSNELGVPVSQISIYMSMMGIVCLVFGIPLGNIMEKYNKRVVCTIGALCMGLGELSMAFYTQVWQWYVSGVFMGIGMTLVQWLMVTSVINKWFKERTGFFLGLCFAMTGAGGIVFNLVGQTVLAGDVSNWRTCYFVYGICMLALSVPFTMFAFRGSPEEWGTIAYGAVIGETSSSFDTEEGQKPVKVSLSSIGMSYKDALRKPYFWILMLAGGLMNWLGIFPQLFTTFVQFLAYDGFGGVAIVALLGMFGVLEAITQGGNMVGKVAIGAIADKKLPYAFIVGLIGGVGGCALILAAGHTGVIPMMWVGGIMYGFIYPFVTVIHPYMVRTIFGQKDYEKIFSRQMIFIQGIGAIGSPTWALVYENFTWNGYFALGMILVVVVIALAFIVLKWGLKDTNRAYDPHVQNVEAA